MRIEESCTQGRYAVATEDIPPGTVVAAGPPTVALLNPDNRCHHLTNSYLHNIYTLSTQYLHIISTRKLVAAHCLVCLVQLGDSRPPHPCFTCSQVVC